MSYSAEFRTLGDLFDRGRFDSETKAVYRQYLMAAGLFLQGELQRNTPVYTGAMAKAWFTEYDEARLTVTVANPSEHALPVELGHKPVSLPIVIFALWAKRKFSLDDKAARRVGFFIAKKKREKPTEGKFFARDTFKDSVAGINQGFLQPIGVELVRRLSL